MLAFGDGWVEVHVDARIHVGGDIDICCGIDEGDSGVEED
jgi:hypothetical protein